VRDQFFHEIAENQHRACALEQVAKPLFRNILRASYLFPIFYERRNRPKIGKSCEINNLRSSIKKIMRDTRTGEPAAPSFRVARETRNDGAAEIPHGPYGAVTVFASIATAPLRARARPVRVAPVSRVIDSRLRIVPWKIEFVPSVAELETCQ